MRGHVIVQQLAQSGQFGLDGLVTLKPLGGEASVLQDVKSQLPVAGPGITLQVERLTFAPEVVKLAAFYRLADAVLDDVGPVFARGLLFVHNSPFRIVVPIQQTSLQLTKSLYIHFH
jgi:hypothetical protein